MSVKRKVTVPVGFVPTPRSLPHATRILDCQVAGRPKGKPAAARPIARVAGAARQLWSPRRWPTPTRPISVMSSSTPCCALYWNASGRRATSRVTGDDSTMTSRTSIRDQAASGTSWSALPVSTRCPRPRTPASFAPSPARQPNQGRTSARSRSPMHCCQRVLRYSPSSSSRPVPPAYETASPDEVDRHKCWSPTGSAGCAVWRCPVTWSCSTRSTCTHAARR